MIGLREDGEYLLGVKDTMSHLPGTTVDKCMLCGEEVWVAKSSQGIIFDGIICIQCVAMIPNKDKRYEVRRETLEELKEFKSGRCSGILG